MHANNKVHTQIFSLQTLDANRASSLERFLAKKCKVAGFQVQSERRKHTSITKMLDERNTVRLVH
jgi:hypothetical protein